MMPLAEAMPLTQASAPATEENQALVVSRKMGKNKQTTHHTIVTTIYFGRKVFSHLGSRSVYPKCLANPFWEAHLSCRFWTTVSRKPLATPQLNIQYKIPNQDTKPQKKKLFSSLSFFDLIKLFSTSAGETWIKPIEPLIFVGRDLTCIEWQGDGRRERVVQGGSITWPRKD